MYNFIIGMAFAKQKMGQHIVQCGEDDTVDGAVQYADEEDGAVQ